LTEGATVAAVTSNDADLILDDVVPEKCTPRRKLKRTCAADAFEEVDDLDEELDEAEESRKFLNRMKMRKSFRKILKTTNKKAGC
jgi:hypothetical protein